MPFAQGRGARLHYEETGSGTPIVFVHEFGSDLREWECQIRWFAREYRCIRFNARGYPPSDVPQSGDLYGYTFSRDDIGAVMDAAGVDRAHIVGLSMGGYAALQFALASPERALSIVLAATGSGSVLDTREQFRAHSRALADRFLAEGAAKVAEQLGVNPTRVQLLIKDPNAWNEWMAHLAEHSALGSAMTMRHYQAERPSLFDLGEAMGRCKVPTLLIVGDEDDPCIEPSIFVKRAMQNASLSMVPGTGHAVNLEEPAIFNDLVERFLGRVDRGRQAFRDPRTRG